MTKKLRAALMAGCGLVLAALWTWRFCTMNAYYAAISDRSAQVYSLGEIVPFEDDYLTDGMKAIDCSIRVDDFEIVEYDAYVEAEGIAPVGYAPEKLGLVHVTVFNEGSETRYIYPSVFKLHGIDNYVGLDRTLITAINPILEADGCLALEPGGEYQLVIPFDVASYQFGSDTWAHLDRYTFYFHAASYPTEKDIQVTG